MPGSSAQRTLPRFYSRGYRRAFLPLAIALVLAGLAAWLYYFTPFTRAGFLYHWNRSYPGAIGNRAPDGSDLSPAECELLAELSAAALERTTHKVRYDPSYVEIPYPMGDVPDDTGVCADVIIRSLRGVGVDLQQLVHEDMVANPRGYPRIWFSTGTDTNIDHRRVQNLAVFFRNQGAALPLSDNPTDYLPGDVVVWRMYNRRLHMGIVVNDYTPGFAQCNVVHNIGHGPKSQNRLFRWPIIGHFRYLGD